MKKEDEKKKDDKPKKEEEKLPDTNKLESESKIYKSVSKKSLKNDPSLKSKMTKDDSKLVLA